MNNYGYIQKQHILQQDNYSSPITLLLISQWDTCLFLEARLCLFPEGFHIILKLELKLASIAINTPHADTVIEKLLAN